MVSKESFIIYLILDMDLRNFNNIPNERNCSSASIKKLNGYTFEKIYIKY